jgi:dienelactone hydrolase
MTEFPGITPDVARFTRWIRDAGFTVWLPSLFGTDGAVPTMELAGEAMESPCVRREFTAFARGGPSPMVGWLRQLAAHAYERSGGPGVGAIGMCFTGSFALSMMLEPSVLAPVMCQPSLPLDEPTRLFMQPDEIQQVQERLDADDLTAIAFRFDGDPYCPAGRFANFAASFGDRFQPTVLPTSAAGDPGWLGVAHSVVTTSLIDEAGEPTAEARDAIIEFLRARLRATE